MGTRRSQSPPWQIILEEMRSENRATLEAVLTFRAALEARIERLDKESQGRDEIISLAINDIQGQLRDHSSDLTELKRFSHRHGADIAELKLGLRENTVELRSLSQKVDALNRLEERIAALEKRAVPTPPPPPETPVGE